VVVRVPLASIEQVEDAHLVIGHSLCVALRERLRAESVLDQQPVPEPVALQLGL
jgi:D-sedoheptulose 7-phosphate isomerase